MSRCVLSTTCPIAVLFISYFMLCCLYINSVKMQKCDKMT